MMVKKPTNLHEEQLAQGAKEAGVLNYPIYAASPKVDELTEAAQEEYNRKRGDTLPSGTREKKPVLVFIETERFIDARAFAEHYFGVPLVDIKKIEETPQLPIPRWQLRWNGHASVSNANLIRQVRRISNEEAMTTSNGWKEIREVDFKNFRDA